MLDDAAYDRLDSSLAAADAALEANYPGDAGGRQPVHTVYVPADRYTADLPARWGGLALALVEQHLPDADALAELIEVRAALASEVLPRVRAKLAAEPIEDLRVDFEDGLGAHPDEDTLAEAAGAGLRQQPPPFSGIRFKSLEPDTRRRGVRTLDVFLGALGPLPPGFVVTLPKVTHVEQVSAFATLCAELEAAHGLAPGSLRFEVQIETPQAILAADGTAAVAAMVHAGAGRVTGLHYGTYDYSAAVGVAAPYQSLAHPAADHAKAVMQLAAAGTGVRISDGSSNVLPVGTPAEIGAAWRLHAQLVRRSLERAFYQGWDLHAGQLVTRYAATYAFYRAGFPVAADRLRAYLGRSTAGVLDEPATAQAMAALLVRGLQCGALDDDEVGARAGADREQLDTLYRRRIG